MLLASDNFNRSNANPIGSPWTTVTSNGGNIVIAYDNGANRIFKL